MNPEIRDIPIVDNKERARVELTYQGHTAILEYSVHGTSVLFPHTLVPPPIEGNGIAARMSAHALDFARENNLSVIPACPFVAQFISENLEYGGLVPASMHRSYGIVIPPK